MRSFILTVALLLGGLVRAASAATIYVTYLDPRPISAGPGCTLPEAIYSSILHDSLDGGAHGIAIDATDPDDFIATGCVRGTGNDTIVLPTRATVTVNGVLDGDAYNPYGPTATPIISSNITIEGNGATIAWHGPHVRLFAVGPASITTPHGTATGTGNLTVRNVTITGFHVQGGQGGPSAGAGMGAGGAIYLQSGGLTVENCTFEGNAAFGGNGSHATNESVTGGGGGIGGSGGTVLGGGGGAKGDGGTNDGCLSGCGGPLEGGGGGGGTVFSGGNSSGDNGIGGASGLYCGGNGGDSANDGHPGQCPGGGGGGSGRGGDLFCGPDGGTGNYGGGGGGAVCNAGSGGFGGGGGGGGGGDGGHGGFGGGGGGTASGNNSGGGGLFGGDGNKGSHDTDGFGGGGAALGGAIFNDGGSVTIRNSTFTGNTAVAGVGAPFIGGRIAKGAGGAIFSRNGSLLIVDSTISGNAAMNSGANVNGGVSVIADGAAASFELDDTIIAGNGVAECLVWRSVSASGTHNLIVDSTVPGFPSASKELPVAACPGVTVTADPQLQALANNGGYTPTMAIPFGSSAMSAADSATSLATDQRGETRPQVVGGWDIGAFEVCRRYIGPSVHPFFCSETTNPGPNGTSPLMMAVSSDTAGTVSPPPGSTDEPNQSVVVVSAKPEPGYIFVGWSGNVTDPTSPTTTIVINQTEAVTANFALEETGFVPPDKATAACENGVAADLTKLSAAIAACHVKAGDAAFKQQDFGEEVCEQTARTAYDAATAKLKGCPPCLDATTLGTLAVQAETALDQHDAEIHCAGTAPLDNDDGGFVPPDRASRTCEDGVGKSAAKLLACIARCHVKTVSQAVKGKPFDEEACETTDATKSCRAKYDAAVGKVLASTRVRCPACLGAAQATQLGDETERDVDQTRGTLYCAGTTALP